MFILGHLWLFCQKSPFCQSFVAYWDTCENQLLSKSCQNQLPSKSCENQLLSKSCENQRLSKSCENQLLWKSCENQLLWKFCQNPVPISKSDKLKWAATKIFIGNLRNILSLVSQYATELWQRGDFWQKSHRCPNMNMLHLLIPSSRIPCYFQGHHSPAIAWIAFFKNKYPGIHFGVSRNNSIVKVEKKCPFSADADSNFSRRKLDQIITTPLSKF